jgi:hypothetical protein
MRNGNSALVPADRAGLRSGTASAGVITTGGGTNREGIGNGIVGIIDGAGATGRGAAGAGVGT